MLLTTTPTIEGCPIKEYFGIVTGESIIGANYVKDMIASIKDMIGGRAQIYEKVLVKAKESALKEMTEHAKNLGANAIVGISLDYETMGETSTMLMVSCSGTAVRIEL